ncbi:thioesterase superfamily protein [Colletotrichum graminicola]|uniref:Thioesterase superfamily protein n=1 Tax=Colletotrichum graminicola (strain M1.001 / M2 / FGSC 10212) TaxID=645133 RepID=E3QXE8_COLGM|nr:thioesterase superfamily protein [Colletotrichum graminicola M1.001]EFQ35536.1 thioesterase superfamily protein [Colletotrichum graminicola M1.001]WDK19561.1 thioesterase superfamily protein [Colletotrichum graminicola]
MPTKSNETSGVGHLTQTVAELEVLPWCRTILTQPGVTIFTPQSRDPKNTNPHDRFFGETLNHAEGIPACVSFHPESPGKSVITELSILFALSRGVDGYPGIAHGGIVATLIDEVLGVLIQRNMETERDDPIFKMNTVTSSMDIKYLKPITTPGVVLGVGQIKEIRGKRMLLRATIKDSNGVDLVTCDAVWIGIPRVKL